MPRVSDAEVRTVLAGLEPGRYRTQDLYRRYLALAEQTGIEPAGRQSLGMSIGRVMAKGSWGNRLKTRGHANGLWDLTPEFVAQLAQDTATPTP